MFFSEEMKQTIPDKEILKRLQRSEIRVYLIGPIFLVLFGIVILLLTSYRSKQDWYPFYIDPYGTSVYAHGEVFTDIWRSGTPNIIEHFSDYGMDYRNFEEGDPLVLFEFESLQSKQKKIYAVEEFSKLTKEAKNKSLMSVFISTAIYSFLLIFYTLIAGWDYAMGLRWLKSGSDDVNDLYRLLRKKTKKEHKRNKQ